MGKAAAATLLCVISLISVSSGTDVPALIWSPYRPLSELPDVFAGHSVSTTDFQNKYLKPLSSGDVSALVVFVQDQLSLDDFTHYADVYNPDSTGGAFENVKDFMDEHFSVQLPHVKSPLKAVEILRRSYSGKVHDLKAPYDVSSLSMSVGKSSLIVVHLPESRAHAPKQSIAQSDKLIAKVLDGLTNQGVQYTAVYTAQSQSQEAAEPLTYRGRHLLETPSASSPDYNQSIWVNGTCGSLYALSIQVISYDESGSKQVENLTELTVPEFQCGNSSDPSGNVWTLTFAKVILKFNFTIKPQTQNMDWYIADLTLSYSGNASGSEKTELTLDARNIWAPLGLSYHCAVPAPIEVFNSTLGNTTLLFKKLQLQPFDVKNGKFGLPWDCVGFFTAPIWMALFSIIILLLILAYGLWMILSINVMDRFDDAKGKTITINAQE